jgi:hypothetical protein
LTEPCYLIDSKLPAPLNRRQRGSGCGKSPKRISPKRRIERYGKQRKEVIRRVDAHSLNC